MMIDTQTLAALAAGFAILMKLLDRLIPSPLTKLAAVMAKEVHDLHESHLGDTARDADGRLKWWVPSDLLDETKRSNRLLEDIRDRIDITETVAAAMGTQAAALSEIAAAHTKSADNHERDR